MAESVTCKLNGFEPHKRFDLQVHAHCKQSLRRTFRKHRLRAQVIEPHLHRGLPQTYPTVMYAVSACVSSQLGPLERMKGMKGMNTGKSGLAGRIKSC